MDCDSTGTVLGDALADRRRHRPAAVKDEWILDTRGRSFVGQHDLDSLNHVIRSLDVEGTGLLETIAGTGEPGWSGDGTAVAALLSSRPDQERPGRVRTLCTEPFGGVRSVDDL
ncbi:unnamed protein product [Durusdinium trenchii]|uniref:Uncharacterized protein n=1 Tax=Durusdinium trenchii TaxID=1381693 RepID=A0ABP0SFC1_9DINO